MDDKQTWDEPVDLAVAAADDDLLAVLGRGGQPPEGDDVATMLAAWRADLADDLPEVAAVRGLVAPTRGVTSSGTTTSGTTTSGTTTSGTTTSGTTTSGTRHGAARPATFAANVRTAAPVTAQPRRLTRERRRLGSVAGLVAAAAAMVALGGSVTLGALDARPGSPLWPVTRLLYAERARSVLAEQDVTQAVQRSRDAIAAGRYREAETLLDQATNRIRDIDDSAVVARLLAEIAAVRALVPGHQPLPGGTAPAGSSGGAGGSAGTGGGGSGTTAPPSSTPSGGLPIPVPPLPLPSISVGVNLPLPSVTL